METNDMNTQHGQSVSDLLDRVSAYSTDSGHVRVVIGNWLDRMGIEVCLTPEVAAKLAVDLDKALEKVPDA